MGDDLKALPNIDVEVYTTLATKFREMKAAIENQIPQRLAGAQEAMTDWQGEAAKQFIPRYGQGETDARELIAVLQAASDLLDGPAGSLKVFASEENERRRLARDWLRRRDEHEENEGFWNGVGDFFTGEDWEEEIGPMPSGPKPEPSVEAPAGQTTDDRTQYV